YAQVELSGFDTTLHAPVRGSCWDNCAARYGVADASFCLSSRRVRLRAPPHLHAALLRSPPHSPEAPGPHGHVTLDLRDVPPSGLKVPAGRNDGVGRHCVASLVPGEERGDSYHQHDPAEVDRKLYQNIVVEEGQQDITEY